MACSKSYLSSGPSWLLLVVFSASWIESASANNICRHPPLAFASQSSPSLTQKSQAQAEHSSGRRWKNRRKRQTFLPSPVRQVTPQEEAALLDQLGYVPPNICKVSARSGNFYNGGVDEIIIASDIDTSSTGFGRPIAIQSYPLIVQCSKEDGGKNNQTPFPTMYWLTDPHVSRAISELERNGYVRQFQSRLEDDTSLAKEWWQCHEEYALERWELLSDSDKEWLLSTDQIDGEKNPEQRKIESMREMIQYSGVAGTDHKRLRETDHDDKSKDTIYVPSVKCLHSHYAHYRSQNESENTIMNVVGKWTHELLIEEFPDLVI